MADELQALLERINQDGVTKAEQERDRILSEARNQAERIVKDAKAKAETIVADAREESELLVSKGKDSLRQAARDILLSLRQALQERMQAVAKAAVASDVDAEALAEMIGQMADRYMESGGAVERIEALTTDKQADKVRGHLMKKLAKNLQDNATVTPLPNLEGGFKLRFNDDDILYDFSDEALSDALCTFVNPRLAELVRSDLPERDGSDAADDAQSEDAQKGT